MKKLNYNLLNKSIKMIFKNLKKS